MSNEKITCNVLAPLLNVPVPSQLAYNGAETMSTPLKLSRLLTTQWRPIYFPSDLMLPKWVWIPWSFKRLILIKNMWLPNVNSYKTLLAFSTRKTLIEAENEHVISWRSSLVNDWQAPNPPLESIGLKKG